LRVPEDQRAHIVRALASVAGVQVRQVAEHRLLVADPVVAVQVVRVPAISGALPEQARRLQAAEQADLVNIAADRTSRSHASRMHGGTDPARSRARLREPVLFIREVLNQQEGGLPL